MVMVTVWRKTVLGVGLVAGLLTATQSMALVKTNDYAATFCYDVDESGRQKAKHLCSISYMCWGGDTSVTTYEFDGNSYSLVSERSGNWLGDEPYKAYSRGVFFERLDTDNYDAPYQCYQTASVDFCIEYPDAASEDDGLWE